MTGPVVALRSCFVHASEDESFGNTNKDMAMAMLGSSALTECSLETNRPVRLGGGTTCFLLDQVTKFTVLA